MEISAEINGFTIMLLLIGVGVAASAGYAYGSQQQSQPTQTQAVQAGLTEADINAMLAIEYLSGTCERLGLISTVYWQQDDQNRQFGTPICIQGGQ